MSREGLSVNLHLEYSIPTFATLCIGLTQQRSILLPASGIEYIRMKISRKRWLYNLKEDGKRVVAVLLAATILVTLCPFEAYAQTPGTKPAPRPTRLPSVPKTPTMPDSIVPNVLPDSIPLGKPLTTPAEVEVEEIRSVNGKLKETPVDIVAVDVNSPLLERQALQMESDTLALSKGESAAIDSLLIAASKIKEDEWVPREVEFSPDPTKAVWMSALFPGLGQVYNRRYWKLPLIVGGYLGLAYATDWNSGMLRDYTTAYADLMDNDPNTKSYMDFFSPSIKEESLDRSWLENVLKSRKNYFRRNRDLCIISMIGVYLLAMLDAYVDASLSHFDISPDLSMDVAPSLMQDGRQRYPSVGLVWALTF